MLDRKLKIAYPLLGFLLLTFPGFSALAVQPATFHAVMVYASDAAEKPDRRIAGITRQLQRVFKFKHYKLAGQQNATIKLPGEGRLVLGGGFSLSIFAKPVEGGKVRTQVVWKKGGSTLINTQVVLSKTTPTIIGGHSHRSGKMIVTLRLK